MTEIGRQVPVKRSLFDPLLPVDIRRTLRRVTEDSVIRL
jgi:hypothetical protein